MKALMITDGEFRTAQFEEMRRTLRQTLETRLFSVEETEVDRGNPTFCMGCFGCWVKKPGECVINDKIAAINRSSMASDAVFYLCPIVFGQFSANMKNVIDRWLPNMLPFFETRPDGSTMHPPRYHDYPRHIMIGYASGLAGGLDAEDAQLFIDISKKHRSNIEVLIYDGDKSALLDSLERIQLVRTGGQL